jgi:hypothetical protein
VKDFSLLNHVFPEPFSVEIFVGSCLARFMVFLLSKYEKIPRRKSSRPSFQRESSVVYKRESCIRTFQGTLAVFNKENALISVSKEN